MGELLLELLTEEIPARMQRRALDDLIGLIRDKLVAANIAAEKFAGYATPRRLTVIANGIPARQPDREEERRGPRVGAPEQALNGFLRSAGLTSIEQCEVRGEFHFAVIKRPGRATAEVLPELIHAAMTALPWPKSMRYPASELRWVRPLNSVICLFDGEVLNLPLDEVPVGRVTRGHRFLSAGEISVTDAADYREKLAKAHVVLDWHERRARVETQLREKVTAEGLLLKEDQVLLDEVTGLVEYPVVLMGSIDADFVRPLPEGLPPEVLATAMRTHQKYFSCLDPDGAPAPRFLFVANNETPDNGAAIIAGNERVLRARLSDAKFFWDQDCKVRLEDRVEALKQRVYHEKLGSEFEMKDHAASIAGTLSELIGATDEIRFLTLRAASLARTDLSTGTVGEFPELQGIVGGYLALNDDEDPRVADAITEQYKPLGPNDSVPTGPVGVNLALAEKIGALVALFSIGEKPTGSRDPFALRRAALGIIRTILENKLRLRLVPALAAAASIYAKDGDGVTAEVIDFIAERLKVHLRERGVRHDLIAAVFASNEDDLVRLLARVDALQLFLNSEDGANLLIAYRRASNIVSIEEERDNCSYQSLARPELLQLSAEMSLHTALEQAAMEATGFIRQELFEDAMAALAALRRPIDEFFERVTVNAPKEELRENRLRLLARIRSTMNQIADFSQIEG